MRLTDPVLFFGVAPSRPQCYGNLKELPVNPGVAFPGHHYWRYCLSRMQLRDVSPSYLLFHDRNIICNHSYRIRKPY